MHVHACWGSLHFYPKNNYSIYLKRQQVVHCPNIKLSTENLHCLLYSYCNSECHFNIEPVIKIIVYKFLSSKSEKAKSEDQDTWMNICKDMYLYTIYEWIGEQGYHFH